MSKANGLPSEQSERSSQCRYATRSSLCLCAAFSSIFPVPKGRSSIFHLVFLALLFITALYFAPYYLVFSQKPERSDAVILLVAGSDETRYGEARQLVHEGYAEYLIIPAFNQVLKADLNRSLAKAFSISAPPAGAYKTSEEIENTHLEIAQARRIIEGLGFTSAIFVSSPYHMRRIKVITGHVFKPALSSPPFEKEGQGGFRLYTVPSRYETPGKGIWLFNRYERNFVLTEYTKIAWFLLYSSFFFLAP